MKKTILIVFFLFVCGSLCSVSSVSAYSGGLLDGKPIWVNDKENPRWTTKLTDNDKTTYENLYDYYRSRSFVYTFSSPRDITSYYFDASSTSYTGMTFYDAFDKPILNLYEYRVVNRSITAVKADKVKKIVISSVTSDNNAFYEFDVWGTEPDTTPPQVPKGLAVTPSGGTASATWQASSDFDVLGYILYLDGKAVNTVPVADTKFELKDLEVSTSYKVSVAAIDKSGNLSAQSPSFSFTTLKVKTIPTVPTQFSVVPYNAGAVLSWKFSPSAEYYKVYKEGKWIANVYDSYYKVQNLVNNDSYGFQVSAVNVIGESAKTDAVYVTPRSNLLPDVSLSFRLKDVADSVSGWLASYWSILAFAISIPLAFWLSRRLKELIRGV